MNVGSRIGAYEVIAKLGEGGMGEVYRARDTKLHRDVAIKILPDLFATDSERLARFEREAQMLAALNHPNIAHIHGFEDSRDVRALIMELVEGPTLADRIAAGPMAVDEVLPIARQIAEALEAAHAQGIVHRDLKPANIKIHPSGTVKVLDFGLAKAGGSGRAGGEQLLNSPTITSPAMTAAGMILGTAAYMSPEQARGRVVDHRADIWAFGAVLFEMLARKRAFDGDEITDVLASVLKSDPRWAALPPDTHPALRRLIARCLEKDPRRRLQSIGEARIQLEDLSAGGVEEPTVAAATSSGPRRTLPWAIAAIGFVAAIAMLIRWSPWRAPEARAPIRINASLGPNLSLATLNSAAAAVLSPDGTVLAYVARPKPSAPAQLFVRRLADLEATLLAGTEGAISPFFSPDGQWVAFFANGKLKKVSIAGGAVVTLADAVNSRGGSWGEDGSIVFAENRSGLFRVPSAGGQRETVTTLVEGEITHRTPQVLNGGTAVLYTAHNAPDNFDASVIVIQPLPSGERTIVHRGGYYGRYLPSGHLLYIHNGTLFALPFDLARRTAIGTAIPLIESVTANPNRGEAQFAVSDTGMLLYLPAPGNAQGIPMMWIDPQATMQPLRAALARWANPRFSPDGTQLAFEIYDGKTTDVWTYDWARETSTRLTFDTGWDEQPVWTPDGRRVTYISDGGGNQPGNIYWRRADGSDEPQRLTTTKSEQSNATWHPSGRFLAYEEVVSAPKIPPQPDIMILPMEGSDTAGWKPGTPFPFLNAPYMEMDPAFSPDGRWIAYASQESGIRQVFVRPFPSAGGRWQVSIDGGRTPIWSAKRSELLYLTLDGQVMVASYSVSGESLRLDKPRPWMAGRFPFAVSARVFDLHPDGNRIAGPPLETESASTLVFVFNFFDELRRLAPPAAR